MGNDKTDVTFTICEDHQEMLEEIVKKYSIADQSKAIRIILDYVAQDANLDEIFENIRCRHC